jgi:aryl-alcohol dehydrogenase-like predicted oxidoreductase
MAQGDDVIPIPGTKKVSYLEENIAAADIVLTQADLAAIDAALPAGAASGERYAPEAMRALNG